MSYSSMLNFDNQEWVIFKWICSCWIRYLSERTVEDNRCYLNDLFKITEPFTYENIVVLKHFSVILPNTYVKFLYFEFFTSFWIVNTTNETLRFPTHFGCLTNLGPSMMCSRDNYCYPKFMHNNKVLDIEIIRK